MAQTKAKTKAKTNNMLAIATKGEVNLEKQKEDLRQFLQSFENRVNEVNSKGEFVLTTEQVVNTLNGFGTIEKSKHVIFGIAGIGLKKRVELAKENGQKISFAKVLKAEYQQGNLSIGANMMKSYTNAFERFGQYLLGLDDIDSIPSINALKVFLNVVDSKTQEIIGVMDLILQKHQRPITEKEAKDYRESLKKTDLKKHYDKPKYVFKVNLKDISIFIPDIIKEYGSIEDFLMAKIQSEYAVKEEPATTGKTKESLDSDDFMV